MTLLELVSGIIKCDPSASDELRKPGDDNATRNVLAWSIVDRYRKIGLEALSTEIYELSQAMNDTVAFERGG